MKKTIMENWKKFLKEGPSEDDEEMVDAAMAARAARVPSEDPEVSRKKWAAQDVEKDEARTRKLEWLRWVAQHPMPDDSRVEMPADLRQLTRLPNQVTRGGCKNFEKVKKFYYEKINEYINWAMGNTTRGNAGVLDGFNAWKRAAHEAGFATFVPEFPPWHHGAGGWRAEEDKLPFAHPQQVFRAAFDSDFMRSLLGDNPECRKYLGWDGSPRRKEAGRNINMEKYDVRKDGTRLAYADGTPYRKRGCPADFNGWVYNFMGIEFGCEANPRSWKGPQEEDWNYHPEFAGDKKMDFKENKTPRRRPLKAQEVQKVVHEEVKKYFKED